MQINLFLIAFIVGLGFLLGTKDSLKNRRLYVILCTTVLVFVAAMRSPEWMAYRFNIDTLNYRRYFEESIEMSWNDFWRFVTMHYSGVDEDLDIGFIGLNKFIGLFTHDFHFYSLLADLLFFIPFGLILIKYCSDMRQIVFALVFYVALVQIYLFGGARQIYAMGFDMMAFLAIADRKLFLAVVFFIGGVTIHLSSILFLIPLLLIWLRVKPSTLKALHVVCFVFFPVVLLIPNDIIVFMGNAIGVEKYAAYGEGAIQGGASTFIILIELLSLFCLLFIKTSDLKKNRDLQVFYVMAPLFTLFAPLINANGSLTRIALYYYLFLSLLVPFAIECSFGISEQKLKGLAYVLVIGLLAFLSISGGGITYYFYWQY